MATDPEGAVERFTLDLIEIEDHINAERVRLVQHSDDDWSVRYLGDLAKDGRTILDALASITRERDAMREGLGGFADDYQTSERHHPDHVLIPRTVFERVCRAAALVNGEASDAS